jgi:hypothetical protein
MPLVVKVFKSAEDENVFLEAHPAARVFSPNVLEPEHARTVRIVLYEERGLARWRNVMRLM